VAGPDWPRLANHWPNGEVKLALTQALLRLRQAMPDVFIHGDYRALTVHGPDAGHIVAFARTRGRDAVVVVVGRHFVGCTDGGRRWNAGMNWDAAIDLTDFQIGRDVLRSGEIDAAGHTPLSVLFDAVPVAVLRATLASNMAEPAPRRRIRAATSEA
jgi:(1->4)-alpha-D-glucan 1-alpha-D-glucosylmutase